MRSALEAQLASWRQVRESADPYLSEMEKMTFGHTVGRLEAELSWHDELLERLPAVIVDGPGTTGDQRRSLRAVDGPGAGTESAS